MTEKRNMRYQEGDSYSQGCKSNTADKVDDGDGNNNDDDYDGDSKNDKE